jgi:hypothetical protein
VELITAEEVNEWVGGPEVAHLAPETIKGIVKSSWQKVRQEGNFLPVAR